MSFSPMKICNSSPCDDSESMYSSSPEPEICDCQNQLGHFDWNGIPHENLPDLCKQTMAIGTKNIKNDDTFTFESDDHDISATKPDLEWEQVVLKRASRHQFKVLARNTGENVEGTNLMDTDREVGIIVDKCGAGDRTSKKSHKRRMSDKGNAVTWTSKKSKKGMDFRIKLRVGKKQSAVKISVKIT